MLPTVMCYTTGVRLVRFPDILCLDRKQITHHLLAQGYRRSMQRRTCVPPSPRDMDPYEPLCTLQGR
jgi:hypothetical protein